MYSVESTPLIEHFCRINIQKRRLKSVAPFLYVELGAVSHPTMMTDKNRTMLMYLCVLYFILILLRP